MKNRKNKLSVRLFGMAAGMAAIALAIVVSMAASLIGCSSPTDGDETLVSIEVTAHPTKATHNLNEDLDITGIVVTATYSDGTTAAVTGYKISGYDKTTAGTQTLTVTYQGKKTTFTVTVVDSSSPVTPDTPITAADISITPPAKGATPASAVSGQEQERFTSGTVTWLPADNPFKGSIVYTAKVTLTAKSGYTFTDVIAKVNGDTASVTNNTGETLTLSHTFAVTGEKIVSGIAIKSPPANLNYTHGDKLDLAGLVVTLTYDDATTEDVDAADFSAQNIGTDPGHGIPLVHTTYDGNPITITYGDLPPLTTDNLTVSAKSVSSLTIDPIADQTYAGSAIEPAVTVKHSTNTLALNTDYTLSYSNNTDAGTATITITGKGDYKGTKDVTFTINKAAPAAGDFDINNLTQIAGSVSPVTIEPKPGKSDGEITIYYEGTDETVYEKSADLPSAIGKYAVTFDIAADSNWNEAIDLSAGTLMINGIPTADDYDIGNLTQFIGSVSAVTIKPKAGKSSGAVTIYYNGSKTLPTAEGSYTVTFDVAAASGWEAASGLPAGTLTINPLLIAYVRDVEGGSYYYINQFGSDLFPSKRFYNAGGFAEGLAAVRDENISGTYYYIDKSGQDVFSQKYLSAGSFKEGVAIVSEKPMESYKDESNNTVIKGFDGYITKDGSALFAGDNFTYYYPTSFSEGLVYVRHTNYDNFHYIDKFGNAVFLNEDNSSKEYSTASSFSGGLAYVKDNLTDTYYYYIKPDGTEAFPSKRYYSVGSFSEGLAAVRDTNASGSYYYIDTSGNDVFPSQRYYTANSFSGGLAVVRDSNAANQYYYINKSGQDVFSKKYNSASSFSNGLAYVREVEGGKYGYIKEDGSNLYAEYNFRYDTANSFSAAGLAAAKIGDYWGYIKKDGSNLYAENNFRYFSASSFAKVE